MGTWLFLELKKKKYLNNDRRFAFRLRLRQKVSRDSFDSPFSDLDGVIPVGDGEVSKVGRAS